jgi:hypothetical protein
MDVDTNTECPCNVCKKAKECPSAYVCDELKKWLERRKKSTIKKDVFVANEDASCTCPDKEKTNNEN